MAVTEAARKIFLQRGATVLSDLVRSFGQLPFVPLDRIPWPEPSALLDSVGVLKVTFIQADGYATARVPLILSEELSLQLPGLEGTFLVLGGVAAAADFTLEMDIGPERFELRLSGRLALRFSSSVLMPVEHVGGVWQVVEGRFSEISVDGTISIDGEGDLSLSTSGSLDLPPALIGGTGVVIEAEQVPLVLSDKALPQNQQPPLNPPPEIGPGWRGVFIASAKGYLPPGLAPQSAEPP